MESWNEGYISWPFFLGVVLIVTLVWLFMERIFGKANANQGINIYHIFIKIILSTILIIGFILMKPITHFFIIAIVILLFYPTISGFLRGVTSIYFGKLHEKSRVVHRGMEGTISGIGLQGVTLTTTHSNRVIPFSQWNEEAIDIVSDELPRMVNLLVIRKNGEGSDGRTQEIIKSVLFAFPFLGQPPHVTIEQVGNTFEVSVLVAKEKYILSLINQLKNKGLNVEINKK